MSEIRFCAVAIYGGEWQTALARDMGVSARTVRRWNAQGSFPSLVASALAEALTKKQSAISEAARILDRHQAVEMLG